jgi:hypothetical protein
MEAALIDLPSCAGDDGILLVQSAHANAVDGLATRSR